MELELEKKSQCGRTKQTKHNQWYTNDSEKNKILQFGKTEQTDDIQFSVKRAKIPMKVSSWS